MMGGLSVLTQDLPPFMTLRTGSLNTVTGTNVVGMRRGGIDAAGRRAVKRAYELLYRSHMTLPQAVAAIRDEFAEGLACDIADFVASSERGVCGP